MARRTTVNSNLNAFAFLAGQRWMAPPVSRARRCFPWDRAEGCGVRAECAKRYSEVPRDEPLFSLAFLRAHFPGGPALIKAGGTMGGHAILRAELDAQRRLVDELQIEVRRQRRQIELQFRRSADMQAEIDRLKASPRPGLPIPGHTPARPRDDGSASWLPQHARVLPAMPGDSAMDRGPRRAGSGSPPTPSGAPKSKRRDTIPR